MAGDGNCTFFPIPPPLPMTRVDADGDLSPPRRKRRKKLQECEERRVVVYHQPHVSSDPTKYISEQLWEGGLFLCRVMLKKKEEFEGKCILELGAGVGLCGILASILCEAKEVWLTDVCDYSLGICKKNVHENASLFEEYKGVFPKVEKLDFFHPTKNNLFSPPSPTSSPPSSSITTILAADVIYDEDITEAFLNTLEVLLPLCSKDCIAYITVDHRVNFRLTDLTVGAHERDFFVKGLEESVVLEWSSEVEEEGGGGEEGGWFRGEGGEGRVFELFRVWLGGKGEERGKGGESGSKSEGESGSGCKNENT